MATSDLVCPECGYKANSDSDLKEHKRQHSGSGEAGTHKGTEMNEDSE